MVYVVFGRLGARRSQTALPNKCIGRLLLFNVAVTACALRAPMRASPM